MKKRWKGWVAVGVAGMVVVVLPAMVRPRREEAGPHNPQDGRLYRLHVIRASLDQGAFSDAFAESARLAKDHPDLRPVLHSVMAVAKEGARREGPAHRDFSSLLEHWARLKEDPFFWKLAQGRIADLRREYRIAERMATLGRLDDPFEAMRLRKEILREGRHGLIVRLEAKRWEEIRARYDAALRRWSREEMRGADPDWKSILARIEESIALRGPLDGPLRQVRVRATEGLRDRRNLEKALHGFQRGGWDRSFRALSRIPTNSKYATWAQEARRNIELHRRLEEAVRLHESGRGRRAAKLLADLRKEWPEDLKNRKRVEALARAVPQIVRAWEGAGKLRRAGDLVAARRIYRELARHPLAFAWYRREGEKGMRECAQALRGLRRTRFRSFVRKLEEQDWARSLELWKELALIDEGGEAISEARTRVIPRAPAILAEIERHCLSGVLGASDRAAVSLLESVLRPRDSAMARLDKIKRSHGDRFR